MLDDAVEFVARQVGVAPGELGLYQWSGSTIAYHRARIRAHLGFRECTVTDAEQLTRWPATAVCEVGPPVFPSESMTATLVRASE